MSEKSKSNARDGKIVYIKTACSHEFKTMFDVLNGILTEITMQFVKGDESKKEKGGIKIQAYDRNKITIIYVKLEADKFNEFYMKPDEYSVGIDLHEFYKYIKFLKKDEIIKLYIDEDDEQNIVVNVDNKGEEDIFKLKRMDVDEVNDDLPPNAQFDMMVSMPTSSFRRVCHKIHQFSGDIEIRCTNKQIEFRCVGDCTNLEQKFKHVQNLEDDKKGVHIKNMNSSSKNSSNIFHSVYDLNNIILFNKCCALCDTLQLYLRNDFPLFIYWNIGILGKFLIGFAPKDDGSNNTEMNYNTELDKYYEESSLKMKENI